MVKIINGILGLIGLFMPMRRVKQAGLVDYEKWVVTFSVSGIPFGWIIVAIALIIKFI